jgi:hypothetical protein
MLSTFRKGASIEDYFRAFSRVSGPDLILIKEDFGRALASLSIEWASNINKVSEFFDVLDFQTHNGTLAKSLTPSDLAEIILLNAGSNIDDLIAVFIMAIHKGLSQRQMLGKLRDLFNFINSQRDHTCK